MNLSTLVKKYLKKRSHSTIYIRNQLREKIKRCIEKGKYQDIWENEHKKLMTLLKKNWKYINMKNEYIEDNVGLALKYSAECGNEIFVRKLLKEGIKLRDVPINTIRNGYYDIAKILIKSGAGDRDRGDNLWSIWTYLDLHDPRGRGFTNWLLKEKKKSNWPRSRVSRDEEAQSIKQWCDKWIQKDVGKEKAMHVVQFRRWWEMCGLEDYEIQNACEDRVALAAYIKEGLLIYRESEQDYFAQEREELIGYSAF